MYASEAKISAHALATLLLLGVGGIHAEAGEHTAASAVEAEAISILAGGEGLGGWFLYLNITFGLIIYILKSGPNKMCIMTYFFHLKHSILNIFTKNTSQEVSNCHTRFGKGNRMHPICAPGSSSAHTVDVTSKCPKQCINEIEYDSTLLHD
jgi:hypothetical protein